MCNNKIVYQRPSHAIGMVQGECGQHLPRLARSDVSSLCLSSLTISDQSSSWLPASDTTNLRRGWGSTESRKAYTDLKSLAFAPAPSCSSNTSSWSTAPSDYRVPDLDDLDMEMDIVVDSWGYYVDSPEGNGRRE